jgi:hypothetical protein
MASKLKKTIANDLEQVSGTQNMFFTGVDDEVNKFLDPIVTGYAFIYWVSLPSWFEDDDDLKYFKNMTQRNFRSFSGVGGLELGTAQLNTGFANNEINVVTGITRGNTEFTIGHKEFSGSPMTKMYNKWISLIRDPRTGIATYPKLFDVEYGARNHSGQLLYIVTRPDVTNVGHNNVEYAAFYSNVVPTNVPLDTLYNFEIGSQDSPTIEINFKGFPEIGPAVTEYAKKILAEKIMATDGDSYMPFVDTLGTNLDANGHVAWGETPLSEIYGSDEE